MRAKEKTNGKLEGVESLWSCKEFESYDEDTYESTG